VSERGNLEGETAVLEADRFVGQGVVCDIVRGRFIVADDFDPQCGGELGYVHLHGEIVGGDGGDFVAGEIVVVVDEIKADLAGVRAGYAGINAEVRQDLPRAASLDVNDALRGGVFLVFMVGARGVQATPRG
jgi:hypothetical protein